MLEIINLTAGYKPGVPVLQGFSLTLQAGERVGITGQNGTGKSTLAKAIMGLAPWANGEIFFEGNNLLQLAPHQRNKLGIAFFMQGGRVYRDLTVAENLKAAGAGIKNFNTREELNKLGVEGIELFTNKARLQLPAGNLSGGERHILAFVMTILSCSGMKLLIADEPSAGVASNIQVEILKLVNNIVNKKNTGFILIEQNRFFIKNLIGQSIINLKN